MSQEWKTNMMKSKEWMNQVPETVNNHTTQTESTPLIYFYQTCLPKGKDLCEEIQLHTALIFYALGCYLQETFIKVTPGALSAAHERCQQSGKIPSTQSRRCNKTTQRSKQWSGQKPANSGNSTPPRDHGQHQSTSSIHTFLKGS